MWTPCKGPSGCMATCQQGRKKGENHGVTRMTTGDPRVAAATKGSCPQMAHGVPICPNDQNIPWGEGCQEAHHLWVTSPSSSNYGEEGILVDKVARTSPWTD